MIISLTGTPSSGKSYLARELAKELGLRQYSVGDLRRLEAQKRGLSIAEFDNLDEDTDTMFDKQQQQLGVDEDDFVIDGRLSWHFIPHSFKVFVTASEDERAKRMLLDDPEHERIGESAASVEDARQLMRERLENDKERYKKHYGIDPYDLSHYDLVLDTTSLSKEESLQRVLAAIRKV